MARICEARFISKCLRAKRVAQATILAFYNPLNRRDYGLIILKRSTAVYPQGL